MNQTRASLAHEGPVGIDEASVLLKYLIIETLGPQLATWRRRLRTDARSVAACQKRVQEILDVVEISDHTIHTELLRHPGNYRNRLVEVATEAILSERMAPDLCIKPAGTVELSEILPGSIHHAIVFAATPLFVHEFYPLAVDALEHDARQAGHSRFNVLGVRCDWLHNDGRLNRAIYMDWEQNRLREADLTTPFLPSSVQFICLGYRERQLHRLWSARFTCPQVNPAICESSEQKNSVLSIWRSAELPVPDYVTASPGEYVKVHDFRQGREVVVKPECGTEGLSVTLFGANASLSAVESHLSRSWRWGPVIVEERRDGLLYRDPSSNTLHTLALRLNTAFDGSNYHAESGFAQIGTDPNRPASCGQNGRLLPISAVLANLCRRESGQPIGADQIDLQHICDLASRGAMALGDCLLFGIDCVLEAETEGSVKVVLIEANRRPSGLSRSRSLETGEPGVSTTIWACLEQLCLSKFSTRQVDENSSKRMNDP